MSITSKTSPRVTSAVAPMPRRWRDVGLLIFLVLLVLGGIIGLAMATGWEETMHALTSLSLGEMGLLLGLSLLNYLARGLRWHLFASRLGLASTLW